MLEIAKNNRYKLLCDQERNRMFITIEGLWKTKDGYLEDLKEACEQMATGFTIHVDLTSMKPCGDEIGSVHVAAQKILMDYGLAHTAEVQADRAILRMSVAKYSDNSGMKKRVFLTHAEAERWLDSLQSVST